MPSQLAIIGAGNMAEAIIRSLIESRAFEPPQIVAADIAPQRRELFQNQFHIHCVQSPAEAATGAPTILLCVKPQQMREVLEQIAPVVSDDALIISIAAGVPINFIESFLSGKRCRVIRTMPNTPLLVGEGMVAIAAGTHATRQDLDQARQLFAPAATVIEVTEDKLDAVTALSGSGPAYFFYLIEQMIRAGIELGLSETESRTLAVRTAIGSGKMLRMADESPEELRRRVTSPGGTTEAAITHMQQHKLDQIIVDAIKAAQRRGRELGSKLDRADK